MKILFAGTPGIGIPSLLALKESFNVTAVLTNPDRPQGRKKVLQPSEIKVTALELGLDVYQPEKLNEDFYSIIREEKFDLLVFIAFGKIFKPEFLEIFPLGGINIHPSLLPIYRGASPLSEAIKNGDKESGISIQRAANKMDSGNILLQERFELSETETTGSLTIKVAQMVAPLIVKVVDDIAKNTVTEYEQDKNRVTFCKLIKKEDGIIDWSKNSETILNEIRAYNPWPLAHTHFKDKTLNILEAKYSDISGEGEPGEVLEYSKKDGFLIKTGNGTLYVTCLQLQSKKALDYKSFNNGVQNFVNTLLG